MSVHYGFKINVTNCFSGHEKGSVEKTSRKGEMNAIIVVRPISAIDMHSRSSLASYAQLMKGGART